MSEAFSGQITRSGRATSPGPDVGGEPMGRVDVVAQHLLAFALEVQPDPGHVALHERHRDRLPLPRARPAGRTPATGTASASTPATAAGRQGASAAGPQPPSSAPDSAVAKVTSGRPAEAA